MRQALSVSSLGDVLRALTDLRPDTDIIFLSLSLGKGRHYDIANYIVLRQPSCILFWLIWQMLPKVDEGYWRHFSFDKHVKIFPSR